MRTYILPVILCAISLHVSGQQLGHLVSAHSNAGNNVFSSLDLGSGVYHQISTLSGPFNPVIGETTFDEINSRYFVKSGSNILVIDAVTDVKLDSIPNTGSF